MSRALLLDAAWRAADRHALSVIDENGRHSINGLTAKLVAGQLPEWQTARLMLYWTWWENVWNEYERAKTSINKGIPTIYDVNAAGPCPGNIWWLTKE